jgi:hypothetical protein
MKRSEDFKLLLLCFWCRAYRIQADGLACLPKEAIFCQFSFCLIRYDRRAAKKEPPPIM